MIAVPHRQQRGVVTLPFLSLIFLLAFSLAAKTALAATVSWVTPPPSSITSGQSFTVSWSVPGAGSFDANVHWDPTNPGGPGNPSGNISLTCDERTTSCSTFHQSGKTSETLTAPTISPTGFPVVVKYLVHIRVPAGEGRACPYPLYSAPRSACRYCSPSSGFPAAPGLCSTRASCGDASLLWFSCVSPLKNICKSSPLLFVQQSRFVTRNAEFTGTLLTPDD